MAYKLMIVGEAWGREEEDAGKPFVGFTGKFMRAILHNAGFDPRDAYLTNVFNLRPPGGNDIKNVCGTRKEYKDQIAIGKWPFVKDRPALTRGKLVLAKYQSELDRLDQEIADVSPNMILAVGATPSWALLDTSGIAAIRGAPIMSERHNIKVFPTYHPSAVTRDFKLRPIFIADIEKALREKEFPEIRRPKRRIWIRPTIRDIVDFYDKYIATAQYLSIDIETIGNQITCIGFAPRVDRALVIPFYDPTADDGNYWPTAKDERAAWEWVKLFCTHEGLQIVGQNFMFDAHVLLRTMGIPCTRMSQDTMLLHHALQPEMQKSLNFLASIYTDELKWKFMRNSSFTNKKED